MQTQTRHLPSSSSCPYSRNNDPSADRRPAEAAEHADVYGFEQRAGHKNISNTMIYTRVNDGLESSATRILPSHSSWLLLHCPNERSPVRSNLFLSRRCRSIAREFPNNMLWSECTRAFRGVLRRRWILSGESRRRARAGKTVLIFIYGLSGYPLRARENVERRLCLSQWVCRRW